MPSSLSPSRFQPRLFLLVLATPLCACQAPLPYAARPLDLPAARSAFAARGLDDPALARFLGSADTHVPQPDEAWTLEALALTAAWFSADLGIRQARWQAALQQQVIGPVPPGGRVDPLLEHHGRVDPGRTTPWTLGLGFEFTLPDPERIAAQRGRLDADVLLARLDLAEGVWTARSAVRRSWIGARAALLQLQWQQQLVMQLKEIADRIGRRVAHGESAPAELERARISLAQAEREQEEDLRQLAAARRTLRVALGLPAGTLSAADPRLPEDLPDPAGPKPDLSCPADAAAAVPVAADLAVLALDNRLDLRADEVRFLRADADLRLQVARQYPEWTLQPGYEWDQGDHRLRIGLSLPFALPAAHQAAVEDAAGVREALARQALARQQQVLQELAQATGAVADALDHCSDAQKALAEADQLERQIRQGLAHGEGDPLTVLEAERATQLQRRGRIEAGVQLAEARGQLEDVLQQPAESLFNLGRRVTADATGRNTGAAR